MTALLTLSTDFDRKALLDVLAAVSPAAPKNSPKPILQNVLIEIKPGKTQLASAIATDLEIGIRQRILGTGSDVESRFLVNPGRIRQLLGPATDERITIAEHSDGIEIKGSKLKAKLTTEPADLYPAIPAFEAMAYWIIAADDLKRAIRRTIYATDPESTRYALGGTLWEFGDSELSIVGTDGRRLARQVCSLEIEGQPEQPSPGPVLPTRALRMIERDLRNDDPPVHVHLIGMPHPNAVIVRTERSEIYARLVEGRYPKYQDCFPGAPEATGKIKAGELLLACSQVSAATSEESRGVDFFFGDGGLRLAGKATDIGEVEIELAMELTGKPVEIAFDPSYLVQCLDQLDAETELTIELIDGRNAAAIKTEDRFTYIIMPLTRKR